MANYLLALEVILALSTIIVVKGQPTAQVCENGDSSNSIAVELIVEAIQQQNIQLQSIHEILTESNQERKSMLDNVMARLQAVDRRSEPHNESIQKFLNASVMEMKNQQDALMTRLQVIDRRSQEQDITIKEIHSGNEFLNDSVQQMQNQLNTAVSSLQADDRRWQHQIESIYQCLNASLTEIKNQQNTVVISLQIQSKPFHALINASFQQMITHHGIIIARLEAVDRRSQEQDIHMKKLQSSNDFLNASFQQMKNQFNTAVTSLHADDRRSQEQIETIYSLLNASFKDIKNQQDIVMARCSQEQATSMYHVLNSSFKDLKNQQDTVLRKLEVLEHDQSIIKNHIQKDFWKLEIAQVPDVGEVPVLKPIVNNWIVLMHRFDESLDFNRYWNEYRNGFGDMRRGEFWIGNEKIYRLTNRFAYTLRIEMYINRTWYYAEYSNFAIDSESNKYTLHLSGYSGNAGDSLTNTSLGSNQFHGGMSFTTRDVDNDRVSLANCAEFYGGGGWWFNFCHAACLTCSYNVYFRWSTLDHLESSGFGRLRAARMMIKSK